MKTDSSSPLEKEPIAKECNKNMGKIKSASHASPPDECQCMGHGAGSWALAPCGRAEWTLMLLPQPPSDSPGLRELRRQRPGPGSLFQHVGVSSWLWHTCCPSPKREGEGGAGCPPTPCPGPPHPTVTTALQSRLQQGGAALEREAGSLSPGPAPQCLGQSQTLEKREGPGAAVGRSLLPSPPRRPLLQQLQGLPPSRPLLTFPAPHHPQELPRKQMAHPGAVPLCPRAPALPPSYAHISVIGTDFSEGV